MLKFTGSVLVLISSVWIGFIFSERFKKRTFQLKEMERDIHQLQNEIIYTHTPLPASLFNVYEKSSYPLNEFFKIISDMLYSNKVDSVYEAFEKAFIEVNEFLYINKEDKDIILSLGKTLGESDIEGQKRMFSLTLENLKKQIIEAEVSMKKNVKMYRYLGFTLGMIIIIMFI
ncbi:stage III sporulation protein AB [Clostridium tetanomorphum]|uniref:Stage III sporulation protein SpoAB n=1 Tax=Clostridium tetanomorphum TaxID=1553 RepID=A0A923J0C1_CLOTT|nr:stage III sporulation protein SpoIIIAB [Clostridium tetanomorphum]KAJ51487.1 stage III sporulation protein SpoAB [Clostridium tetanomorphum DSM 665]MBC2396580.1 stage III sporulation protein SpoAB [Clostridium tetanomorphum]MBP1863908.1 stage III sporulation protein AB [Clostridium tetanomorphum]NRS84986.1 stage III sporulation protein AB [Clostridium tetanomorphum]NRZ98202.1 stage III sporulation protein AB [Clostridium tetanomorphum]